MFFKGRNKIMYGHSFTKGYYICRSRTDNKTNIQQKPTNKPLTLCILNNK